MSLRREAAARSARAVYATVGHYLRRLTAFEDVPGGDLLGVVGQVLP